MTDANTALIALASVQGATTVVLAGATWFYAARTHDISKATRRQADASSEMAREMREQRLAKDQPYLVIETIGNERVYFEEESEEEFIERPDPGIDPNKAYPRKFTYRILNAGQGPALGLSTTLWHSWVIYKDRSKDALQTGDMWEVSVHPDGPLMVIGMAFGGGERTQTEGFNALSHLGLKDFEGPPSRCGVTVTCSDIHGRKWLAYLTMHIDSCPAMNTIYRTISPGTQRFVSLEDGEDRP